jgi:hypothetical protein
MKAVFLSLFLSFSAIVAAQAGEPLVLPQENTAQIEEIPTTEKEFVEAIHKFDKAKIIEQFGEPTRQDDLALNKDGKSSASIWQYHYLNTDANGTYYQTTELDFVDDKVVMVVFMNHDGKEIPADAVRIPVPPAEPEL